MIPKFADNRRQGSLSSKLRRKRIELFLNLLKNIDKPEITIADLGGTAAYWENHVTYLQELARPVTITIINLIQEEQHERHVGQIKLRFREGDATRLEEIGDKQFDAVYSNSVIEHVGNLNNQLAMAREVYRIADYHFVQTPSRYFPVEAHVLLPFWPYWPMSLRGWLVSKKQIAWMGRRPDYISAKAACEQVRLLTPFEMKRVFPQSRILREKVLFLTKSLIAISPT